MIDDGLRCRICFAEAQPNAKGRLVLTHDWTFHRLRTSQHEELKPMERPTRSGAWGDDDE
jgi:hypothetical protein